MKVKILLIIAIIVALWQNIYAEDIQDSVWTRELGITGDIYQVQFLPDSKSVAVATGAGVSVFDCQTGAQLKRFNYPVPGNDNPCNSFCFTEDGKKLITVHNDKTLIIWDYLKVDTIQIFKEIALQEIINYGNNVIIGIWNLPYWNLDSSKVCFFDINKGQILKNQFLTGKNTFIDAKAFAISKEKNLFAMIVGNTFDKVQEIFIGNLTTLEKVTILGTHSSQINDFSFSSDGKYLASASSDGIIKIWDIINRKLYKSFLHDSDGKDVFTVKFSPDSKYIVSGISIWDKWNTKIWDIESGELIFKYNFGLILGLDISSNKELISGGNGSYLYMLNSHWTKTDINEPSEQPIKLLFPNPAGSEINIPLEQNLLIKSIIISNLFGQNVKNYSALRPGISDFKVDISSLLSGVYYVSVVYQTKTISFKFEKVR